MKPQTRIRQGIRVAAVLVDRLRDDLAASSAEEAAAFDQMLAGGWSIAVATSLVERRVSVIARDAGRRQVVHVLSVPEKSTYPRGAAVVQVDELRKARERRLRRENADTRGGV